MSWTTLKRALEFADRTGDNGNLRQWRPAMTEIHAEVMERGWSGELQSFRQHYDADTLDASTLLIPLMGFLEPSHPRVAATVRRIEQDLTIDGLVYRFRPGKKRFADGPVRRCFSAVLLLAGCGLRADGAARRCRCDAAAGRAV